MGDLEALQCGQRRLEGKQRRVPASPLASLPAAGRRSRVNAVAPLAGADRGARC